MSRDQTTEDRPTRSVAFSVANSKVPTTADPASEDGARAICPLFSVLCLLNLVGLGRLERPTSRLSGVRSNQLSYRPRSDDRGQMTDDRPPAVADICPLSSVV